MTSRPLSRSKALESSRVQNRNSFSICVLKLTRIEVFKNVDFTIRENMISHYSKMSLMSTLLQSLESPWSGALVTASLILGFFQIAKFTYSVATAVGQLVAPSRKLRSYGQWAVVTGATDGIGKAYCMELAKRGMSVFLLSRTSDRLSQVSKEIEDRHGVQTQSLAVDFANVTSEQWTQIKEKTSNIEVGVLINNVGCSYEHYEFLHSIDDATVHRLIEINVRATVQMTRMVLPGMINRRKGVIINIGSGVGSLLPSAPLLAVYAGTKVLLIP